MPTGGQMSIEVQLDNKGRITIPTDIRKKLDLKPGEKLLIHVSNNSITLQPKVNAKELQEKALKFRSELKLMTKKPIAFEKLFDD